MLVLGSGSKKKLTLDGMLQWLLLMHNDCCLKQRDGPVGSTENQFHLQASSIAARKERLVTSVRKSIFTDEPRNAAYCLAAVNQGRYA